MKTRNSPSPNSKQAKAAVYSAYRSINDKYGKVSPPKKPREAKGESSMERPLRDNFLNSSVNTKYAVSPRAASPVYEPTNIYANVAAAQKKEKAVSASLAFNHGALKESTNLVERLSNNNRKGLYSKI